MTDLKEGERWYDPTFEKEFTVLEDVSTVGTPAHELDTLYVEIQYDGSEYTQTVPHERFRGRRTYERVQEAV